MEIIQPIAQFLAELMFTVIAAVVILFIIIAVGGDVLRYIEKRKVSENGQADN